MIQLLLDSDPAIRWQVMQDLSGAPEHEVAAERARVSTDDSRWLLEHQYPGRMQVELKEGVGQPSRWITLRALRVLDCYSADG